MLAGALRAPMYMLYRPTLPAHEKHQQILYGVLQYIRSKLFRGVVVNVVRRIAAQVLVALRALAAQRIVHCDLKPENILLNSANSLGVTVSCP